jgi:hypothetical protein
VVDASAVRKLNQHLEAAAGMAAAGDAAGAKPSLPDGLWIPPNSCLQLLGDAFVEAGCRVFYSFDDTDKEAAYWAKQHRAYAIITDDTDFLCYEGVERIWSSNIKLPGGACGAGRVRVWVWAWGGGGGAQDKKAFPGVGMVWRLLMARGCAA